MVVDVVIVMEADMVLAGAPPIMADQVVAGSPFHSPLAAVDLEVEGVHGTSTP